MQVLEWGIALLIAIPIAGFIAFSWNPFMGSKGSSGKKPFPEDNLDIRIGSRGGTYTDEVTKDGRPYRRYF